MKQWLKGGAGLALALALVLSMTACGKKDSETSGESGVISGDSSAISSDASLPDGSDVSGDASDSENSQSSGNISGDSGNKNTNGNKNNNGNKNTSGNTVTNDPGTAPAKFKGQTFEYYTWNDTRQSGESLAMENQVIADFEKATGVTVKVTKVAYSSFDVNLASRMTAGNVPDMTYLNGIILSRMQYLKPISELNYNFSDTKTWDADTMSSYTIKGKSYAFNLAADKTLMYRPGLICYNKSEITRCGLDDPYTLWKNGKWTWDEMVKMARKYHKQNASNPGFSLSSFWQYPQLKGIQGPFKFDGKTVSSNFGDQKFLELLKEQIDLRTEGVMSEEIADAARFDQGKMLLVSYNFSVAREGQSLFQNLKNKNALGIVPMPTIKGQSTQYMLGEQSAFAVLKGAKNGDLAPYFVKYYADKSHYNADKWFINKEAMEVYNYAVSCKRFPASGSLESQGQTNSVMEYVQSQLWGAEKEQFQSKVDQSVTNNVKPTISELNKVLGNIN